MNTFLTNFVDAQSVLDAYGAHKDALDGAVLHLAWYGYESYCEGQSLVVFEKDGKLYEVNGSHCSCCGLEGQWEPEETSWAALNMRKFYGYEGSLEVSTSLRDLVTLHLQGDE